MSKFSEKIKQANIKAIKVGARVTVYGGMEGRIIGVGSVTATVLYDSGIIATRSKDMFKVIKSK